MTIILRSIHPTNPDQLTRVVEAMRVLGSPTIRAVCIDGEHMTIEGTHRIEAATLLGIPIQLVQVPPDEIIDVGAMDICDNWSNPSPMPASEVAAGLWAACNGVYFVDDDGHVERHVEASYPRVPPIAV